MEDDDPFSIVKPEKDNKKMSTYLKKQRKIAAADRDPNKCAVEESSHGTTSTRSTTTSNRTDDILYYPTTPSSGSSVRSGGSGSGLRAFGSMSSSGNSNHGHADADGFGSFEDMNIADDGHAIEFGSDFGNGLEFGTQGGGAFGTDCFGHGTGSGTKSVKTGCSSNGRKSSSMDSSGQTRKPKSMSNNFTSGGGDNCFGSDPFAVDPFGASSIDFTQPFEEEEPVNFGDDFGAKFETNFQSTGGEAWRKREEWKNDARSNSSASGKIRDRRLGSHRGHLASQQHSKDGFESSFNCVTDDAQSLPTRQASSRRLRQCAVTERDFKERSSDASVSSSGTCENQRHEPPGTRRSRRASMDQSGHSGYSSHSGHSGLDSRNSTNMETSTRVRRRGSVGYAQSEGSQDLYPSPGPHRHKSAAGPSQVPTPTGSLRPRSRRASMSTSGVAGGGWDAGPLGSAEHATTSQSLSTSGGSGIYDKKWERDRSLNQERIMAMHKEGAMKKSDQIQKSSSNDLDRDLDERAFHDDSPMDSTRSGFGKILKKTFSGTGSSHFGASIGDGDHMKVAPRVASLADSAADESKKSERKKGLHSFRISKSKKAPEDEKSTEDARNLAGRCRGSLLERVGAVDDSAFTSASVGGSKGGSSYSDRILMQQQKSRK